VRKLRSGSIIVALCALAIVAVAGAQPQVVAVIKTGAAPCAAVEGFGSVWVANYGSDTVSRVDPATNKVIGEVAVGDQPCGLAVGAGSVWVDGFGTGKVERIDPATMTVVRRLQSFAPYDVTFAFGSVWSTDYGLGTVSRFNPARNTRVKRWHAGFGPAGLAATGRYVWVGSATENRLYRIDPRKNRIKSFRVPAAKPAWLASNANTVWAASAPDGLVVRVNGTTGKTLARIQVGPGAVDGTVASDGRVWIPLQAQDAVAVIDPATNTVVAKIPVGHGPFVVNQAAGDMWAGSFLGADVWRIRP
jgi:YVTN family beta-propeller protein